MAYPLLLLFIVPSFLPSSLTQNTSAGSLTGGGAGGGGGEDGHTATSQLSEEERSFCARFQLSPDELPLPTWQTGKRCSVMDRDRPLTLTRSGRLYLTHR